jgi:hypothetical protein
VRSEDLMPGVYELDVFAPPLAGATVTVRAELAPLGLDASNGELEVANTGTPTVAGRVGTVLIGAARDYDVAGRGARAETIRVRVPDWAASAVMDVEMPRAQWSEFTGFSVTEFDSAGQQVGQRPLNYASGRQRLAIPAALKRRPLAIELWPAFARADGVRPWRSTVRLRFLLPREQAVGDEGAVSVVAGGRVGLALPALPALAVPEGFAPLVEVRVRPEHAPGGAAVRRVMAAGRR